MPGLLDGYSYPLTLDGKRRLTAARMAEQFNKPTPQDTEVVERGGLLPVGTYANGMTGAAIPGFIYDGFMAPGDALSGKLGNYQDNREEWAKAGFDAAGSAMVGGLAAPRPASNAVGIFGGRLAKTADQAKLAQAEKMAAEGAPRDQIWSQTGWFQGPDKKWRFEIDDSKSVVYPGYLEQTGKSEHAAPFRDRMSHTGYLQAYPEAEQLNVQRISDDMAQSRGFNGTYYRDRGIAFNGSPSDRGRSTALHELQHDVQSREGFAYGGDPRQFETAPQVGAGGMGRRFNWTGETPVEKYRRLAGETEARAVQARRDLTPEERAARPPWLDYDVPENQQIVRFADGTSSSASSQPGTVYSPLTGELLYANGGRQGAATGAAANASAERQGIRAYRGMADNRSLPIQNRKGQVWASSNPEVASQYSYVDDALNLSGEFTQRHVDSLNPRITPLDFRFQNPLVVDHAKDWIFRHTDGKVYDTDSFADMAKSAGHDGIIVKGITDSTKERGDTIAALQPGRTYSALTGELLYSNGGRPGAAVGAAANAAAERQGIRSIDQLGRSDPHPGPVIGYHGTTASFDTFDPAKMQDPLGPFFGTSAMADKFAQPNYARPSQGNPRVIPAQISSNKALDIAEDPSVIGTGRDTYIQPRDLVSSLEGAGLKPLDDPAVKQAFERTSVGNDFKSFRDRMGAERFGMEETSHHTADRIRFDALKDFMARNGYDTIRRWNEAGNGWEYAPVVRGIVQSPETGATLYSGGRPGAAVGAGLGGLLAGFGYPYTISDADRYRGAI